MQENELGIVVCKMETFCLGLNMLIWYPVKLTNFKYLM